MITYSDIRDVHLEISTLCNAACPWCPRNFWGYPYNGGYPEVNLTLESAQKIFQPDFLKQLDSIRINGNFGDIVMNPEGANIVEFFNSVNPNLLITISTNGSARPQKFWQKLGSLGAQVRVLFALDGLEDTHHLYRQNTSWSRIIENAQTFISAGGFAVWKMLQFDHNLHQIEQCRDLSKQLGFGKFITYTEGRDIAPVFDRHGNLSHTLGKYQGPTEFPIMFRDKTTNDILLEDVVAGKSPKQQLTCETKKLKSIYISATGEVSPCCYTGFYPHSYGKGQYHQAVNSQLKPLINKNNAIEHGLSASLAWFANIENSWNISSYEHGRLIICDDSCGV